MQNKIKKGTACVLCILLLFSMMLPSFALEAASPSALAENIIKYNLNKNGCDSLQELADTYLCENAGSTAEWYAYTLARYNSSLDLSEYADALEKYLDENSVGSASSKQKYALVLVACGKSDSEYVRDVINTTIGSQGIMSYVFGLHLLSNGIESDEHTAESVIDILLSLQSAQGGWALTPGKSNPDVTAMVIQALAPYYRSSPRVADAVEKALSCLSSAQTESGDFKSYGVANLESSAQVLLALTSLGIDPSKDSRFIKNGSDLVQVMEKYLGDDGSFSHTAGGASNHSATVQAYYSLLSLVHLGDEAPFYIIPSPDDVPEDEENETEGNGKEDENGKDNGTDKEEDAPVSNGSDSDKVQEDSSTPDDTIGKNDQGSKAKKASYKPYAAAVIILLTAGAAFISLRKKKLKDTLLFLCIGVLALCLVLFTNIQSADTYYSDTQNSEEVHGHVSIGIYCTEITDKTDSRYVPENGIIFEDNEYSIEEGDTVYDLIYRICRENRIQIDGVSGYISGINHIYEFDHGDTSGWIYTVNGETPSVGCDEYILSDGDTVVWSYTLTLGSFAEESGEETQ